MGDIGSLTTFDKSGKLTQIEYALNRVNQGKMSLGIKGNYLIFYNICLYISMIIIFNIYFIAKNGVVLVTDKKVHSVLVDSEEYHKIQSITPTTGFAYAGIGPDYRVLVTNARKSAQKYYLTYRELSPVAEIARETATVMQEYTQSGGVRPFGVSVLVAGYDHEGPQLYQVDPSG